MIALRPSLTNLPEEFSWHLPTPHVRHNSRVYIGGNPADVNKGTPRTAVTVEMGFRRAKYFMEHDGTATTKPQLNTEHSVIGRRNPRNPHQS